MWWWWREWRDDGSYNEESDDEESDGEESDGEESDDDTENEGAQVLIPILEKFKEAVDKFDVLLQRCSLKCKNCEFEAKDQNGLGMHMKAKHKNINKS